MSVELTTIYAPKTDELFAAESKISLLTNMDYDWTGAHTVKVWKISTSEMNDYSRNRAKGQSEVASVSRYGELIDLNAQTEEMTLKKDRSFIFNIDKIDMDETAQQLAAETALARQLREVVIPEVDKYTYGVMAAGAGQTVVGDTTTPANIYSLVLAGSEFLDDNEVPETERALVVVPSIYTMLKQSDIFDKTDVGAEMRARGVVATLDGMNVIKIPSKRMPANFGFMIAHPSATTAPVKLEDYGMHENTPLSSGTIVTGRICYDAFVLDNKKKGIYVYKTK